MCGREATDLPTLSMNQWILEIRLFHLFVAPAGADLESAKDLHTTEASFSHPKAQLPSVHMPSLPR